VTLYGGSMLDRPIAVTDAALIPSPSFDQRLAIVRNAVEAMRSLGIERPRVALPAAVDPHTARIKGVGGEVAGRG
jgi:phosphotransacetylase